MIRILHLSDIHFAAARADLLGRNRDMRERILDDIEHYCGDDDFATVAVTGDIAYSGRVDEYDEAEAWLSRVGECVGEPPTLVVPGNHDVDRSAFDRNTALQLAIKDLKSRTDTECDQLLRSLLADELGPAHVLAPLDGYNVFAEKLGCSIKPTEPVWSRDIAGVRFHGLVTAFACTSNDQPMNVVMGEFQALLPQFKPDAINVTLAHHPPDWLRDHDLVHNALSARAAVQLFGHKHARKVTRVDETVRVVAGAVFPEEHSPGWLPTYGVICLEPVNRPRNSARIRVYQRVWDPDDHRFFTPPDPATDRDFREEIVRLTRGRKTPTAPRVGRSRPTPATADPSSETLTRLMRLPEIAQLKLLVDLRLIKPDDAALGPAVVVEAVSRARDSNVDLDSAVEQMHQALLGPEQGARD